MTLMMSNIGEHISWQGVNKVCSGVVEQRINEQTVLVRLPNNKYIQVYDCGELHTNVNRIIATDNIGNTN